MEGENNEEKAIGAEAPTDMTLGDNNQACIEIHNHLKDFGFSKVWMLNGEVQAWPDDLSIGVTIGRKLGGKEDDQFTALQYKISDPTKDKEFGTNAPKLKATVTNVDGKPPHYKFSLSGLEPGKWVDGTYTEYTYYVKETTVPTKYSASYRTSNGDSIVNGESAYNGGAIVNTSMASYELPSTGGPGTTGLYILGSILTLLAAVLLIIKRRRTDAPGID